MTSAFLKVSIILLFCCTGAMAQSCGGPLSGGNSDEYNSSFSVTVTTEGYTGAFSCTVNVVAGQGQHYLWLRYQETWFDTVGNQMFICGGDYCLNSITVAVSGPGVSNTINLTDNGTAPPTPDSGPAWILEPGTTQVWVRTVTSRIDVSAETVTSSATYQLQVTESIPSDNYTQSVSRNFSVGRSVTLLDPVLSLISDFQIVTDPESLATLGTPVGGVAADSAAQVVIKILAQYPGQAVTLNLLDDENPPMPVQNSGLATYGTVATINGSQGAATVTLTAVATNEGPMAFAVYRPPFDFTNGMDNYATCNASPCNRFVTIQWTLGSLEGSSLPPITEGAQITLWRPPVVLIHGLWSSSGAWVNFTPFITDPRFATNSNVQPAAPWYVDYNFPLPGVTITSPSYPWTPLVNANALGFEFNAPLALTEIQEAIVGFRSALNVAATQADVLRIAWAGPLRERSSTCQ